MNGPAESRVVGTPAPGGSPEVGVWERGSPREGGVRVRRVWLALVAGLLALTVVSAAPAVAKPPVRGEIDLMALAPGSCGSVTWSGTVTFPDGVHGLYLAATDVAPVDRGVTMHYEESFTVVDEPLMLGSCPDGSQTMLLTGWDAGIGVFVNDTFRANGAVTDAGAGYSAWDGHKVHMSGDIVVVESVSTLDGVLQLNPPQASSTVPEPQPLQVEIVDVQYAPDLPGGPYPGDTVSATVRVGNTGPPPAQDVWASITYSRASPLGPLPPGCAADEPTNTIRCDLGDLDGLNPTSLSLTFTAGAPGLLELTAVASAPDKGPPVTATLTVTIAARPEGEMSTSNP